VALFLLKGENVEDAPLNAVGPKFFYGYIVVIAASIISVAAFGVHYAFGIFFKPMLHDFGWGRTVTSGAFSLSWLFQGLSAILMGRLNDRYGPRFVLTLCGIFLFSGYLLTSRVDTVWQLYMSYGVFIGLGTGGVYVPIVSTIARWFVTRRNIMTGIAVSGIGLGTFLLPPVANHLITVYDWRTSYAILGIAVLVVIVFTAQLLRRDPAQKGLMPYGYDETVEHQLQRENKMYSLKDAVCTRNFWLVFGMFFCFGFCLFAIMVHLAPYVTDIGKSTTTAANFIAAIGVASIFGKVLLGSVGDSAGNRCVYIICFSTTVASLFWLISVKETWLLYLFAIAFGLAYGGNATSQSPLVATLFGLRSHGFIMGVINNGFTVGATLGPIAAGSLFDVTGSYQLAFLVIAAMAFLGLVLTLMLAEVSGRHS